jgi:hypothetical protein
MQLSPPLQSLSLFLPEGILEYFDVIFSDKTDTKICIVLEEKNNPPLEERHHGRSASSKGFTEITVEDFPARGRRVSLTFRRRRWMVGDEILKREIPLVAEGTQLEKEFAAFLKERG